MTEPSTHGDAGGVFRRQWPIIAAAVVVAAVAGALWARANVAGPVHTATVRLRVSSNISNVQNAPSADSVVATALKPEVKRNAAESSGIDPDDMQVSAQVETKNRNVITVSVEAPTEEAASDGAAAVAEATRRAALQPLEPFIANEEANAERYSVFQEQLTALLAAAEAGAGRAPVGTQENAAYLGNRVNLTTSRFNAQNQVAESKYLITIARNYVAVDGEPTLAAASDTGKTAAGLVQGAVLGLLVGLVLAFVREGLQRRRA